MNGMHESCYRPYWAAQERIDTLQEQLEELKSANQKLQAALAQASLDLWEYHIQKDELIVPERAGKAMGLAPVVSHAHVTLTQDPSLSPELRKATSVIFEKLAAGDPYAEATVKLRFPDSGYQWKRVSYTTVEYQNGKPLTAIGVSMDITDKIEADTRLEQEKCIRQSLLKESVAFAELDAETGEMIALEAPTEILAGSTSADELMRVFLTRIVHPDDRHLFRAFDSEKKLRSFLRSGSDFPRVECRCFSPSGLYESCRWFLFTITALPSPSTGRSSIFIFVNDIHEKKLFELAIEEQARRDPLTKLLNREAFRDAVDGFFSRRDESPRLCAFYLLDLDNFKRVNDTYGHPRGDEVLREMARRLSGAVRADDVVARMGGDEFAVFVRNLPSRERAYTKGEEIRAAVGGWTDPELRPLSCSVGIAVTPGRGASFDGLYEKSDAALYAAKRSGKSACMLYPQNGEI